MILKRTGFRGFGGLNWPHYENDFKFVIGNKEVMVPLFLAEFLSRKVAMNRKSDPAADYIEFELCRGNTRSIFTKLIDSVKNGEDMPVADDERGELWRILRHELQSDLIYSLAVSGDEVPIEIQMDTLSQNQQNVRNLARDFPQVIAHGMNQSMSEASVKSLLDSEDLMLDNEESLLKFIQQKCFPQLLEYVNPEGLTADAKEGFCVWARADGSTDAWTFVQRMVKNESKPAHSYYEASEEVGPKVVTSGLGCHGGSTDVNCVKKDDAEFLWLMETCDAFVGYDYGERMMIKPTGYTITLAPKGTTKSASDDAPCLRNWVLEGSLSGRFWTTLDEQRGNSDLGSKRTFSKGIDELKRFPCRLIRLRQIGPNDQSKMDFHVAYLKIEGSFFKVPSEKCLGSGAE